MIPDLPPSQLIPWLKTSIAGLQAALKTQQNLLGNLESLWAFNQEAEAAPTAAKEVNAFTLESPITVEVLIEALKQRTGRVKHIARRLNTSEAEIEALIAAAGGRISRENRGWLKLQELEGKDTWI